MAIYRGPGGPGDAIADADSEAALVSTLVTQAQTAATNASNSATASSNSATTAQGHAANAAVSASAASSSASNASTSESNAASSASAASTSATNAANSATAAQTAETNAETAETNAETAETNAAASASAASTSATNAASSASAASTSATNAASSASTASTAATNASNSATAAATSESNSASSASTASTAATNASNSASAASTSASNAATSETNAANSASAAATSATNASNSASAASTSASNAATSETNAANSATAAANSYDAFDDRYLGAKASAPSVDNDGNALLTGALYWDTGSNQLYVWDGSAWDAAAFNVTGGAVTSVDMTVPTGLAVSGNPITTTGTLAVTYATGYSIPTNTKQSNWDTAYSWGNHASAGYLTSYTETDPVVGAINGIVKANGSGTISAATAGTDYLAPAAIGVTVQAYDAGLASIAGLTTAADRMIYTTAADTYAVATLTSAGRALLDDADASAQRTTLGLAIGVDVQAYDADTAKLDVAQSFTAQQTFKELKDTVHTITDGAGFEIDPANGSIQVVTLGAARTPAATNFEAGQVVLLGIDDGTAYTITWTTVAVTWVKAGGTATAPTLATSGYTWVLLWKVGSTIYGTEVGSP